MNFNGSTAYGIKEILEKIESFSFEKVNKRIFRLLFKSMIWMYKCQQCRVVF